jgi:chromosome segregation ATPase
MTEVSDLKEEIERLRREREQLSLRLLELEQRVAASSLAEVQKCESAYNMVEDELRKLISRQQREYDAIRKTLSWRISAPLRKLKSYGARALAPRPKRLP